MNSIDINTPYASLSPNVVMDAVETLGYKCTGAVFALNSYENRVYDVAVEGENNVVVKFYRPHRWSQNQILEEHTFAFQLEEMEVPVVVPLKFDGESLFEYEGYLFSVYPKRGGRSIELQTEEDFREMGRLIARIHNVGGWQNFDERMSLTPTTYGWDNLQFLRECGHVPADMLPAYDSVVTHLLNQIDVLWKNVTDIKNIRVHGDCHLGNILKDTDIFFVDLDDSLMAPAIQDLWLFASGDRAEISRQFGLLLEGYGQLRDFDYRELQLVEALRTLRMIHYTAWIARRWDDPTFKHNFAFFETQEYWANHLQNLREQMEWLHEPILISV